MSKLEEIIEKEKKALADRRKLCFEKVTTFCKVLFEDFGKANAFRDAQFAPVLNEMIGLIKAEQAAGKLNLRLSARPDDPTTPVIKLGEVRDGILTLTTVERMPRPISLTAWPTLTVELAGSGQGSNLTPEIGREGGKSRMSQLSATARKRMGKKAASKRWEENK